MRDPKIGVGPWQANGARSGAPFYVVHEPSLMGPVFFLQHRRGEWDYSQQW